MATKFIGSTVIQPSDGWVDLVVRIPAAANVDGNIIPSGGSLGVNEGASASPPAANAGFWPAAPATQSYVNAAHIWVQALGGVAVSVAFQQIA